MDRAAAYTNSRSHAVFSSEPLPTPVRSSLQRGKAAVLFVATVVSVLLQGCGLTVSQQAAVGKFSAATASLGEIARKEFVQSRADVIEMNSRALELGDTRVDPDKLDEFLTTERVALRTAACDTLKRYGELLHTLATTDQTADLQLARDQFMTSLGAMKRLSLSDEQKGAVGAAIELVGSSIVEAQRRERVIRIVRGASAAVRTSVKLIEQDFDLSAEHWQLGYDATVSRLLNAAKLKTPAGGAPPLGISDAAQVQLARTMAAQNTARRDAAAKEILSACAALSAAERELRMVLEHPDIAMEDVDKFFAGVLKLENLVKILDNK